MDVLFEEGKGKDARAQGLSRMSRKGKKIPLLYFLRGLGGTLSSGLRQRGRRREY